MRRAAKRDANEADIIGALEAIGCTVDQLPGDNGRPDLLVGTRGMNLLIEVKNDAMPVSSRRLNPLQKKWHGSWKGRAHLVETASQAIAVVMHAWKSESQPHPRGVIQ